MARKLLPRQKLLARVYAQTGSVRQAEAAAGYAHQSGYAALRNPEVLAEVTREQQRKLVGDALPAAVAALVDVVTNPNERGSSRTAAAKVILEYTIGRPDSGVEKALDAMTDAELMEALQEAKSRRASLAREILDVEATTVAAPQNSSGALD